MSVLQCHVIKVSTIDGVPNESRRNGPREVWQENDVYISDNVESATDNYEVEDSASNTTPSGIDHQTEDASSDCSNMCECGLSCEVVQLTKELVARTDELKTMERRNDILEASCQTYKSDIEMLEISNQKKEEKCSQFEDQLRSAKDQLEQLGNECGKYFHEKCTLQNNLNSLQEELSRLNEVNKQLEEIRLEYEVHLKETENNRKELKFELEREKASNVKLQTQVKDCESQLLEIRNMKRRLGREAWAAKDARTTELCESVADAHERMKKKVLKLEAKLNEKEQHEAELRGNLEDKEKKITQLESNLQKKEKRERGLKREIELCKITSEMREQKNIACNKQNEELSASLSECKKTKSKLELQKKNIVKKFKKEQNELVQEIDKLRKKNVTIVRENELKKGELDNLIEESQNLGEENSLLKKQNRVLQQEKNENEIKHKEKTDEKARELAILLNERQNLKDRIKAVDEEITKIRELNYLLQKQKNDLEKERENLASQMAQFESQLRYQTKLDQRKNYVKWFIENLRPFDLIAQGLDTDATRHNVIVHDQRKPLGCGAWCIVYSGSFGKTPVAIKSFHALLRESAGNNSENLKFDNEILFGFVCRHPNIVQFLCHTMEMKVMGPILLMEKMFLSLLDLITHEIGSAPIKDIPWDVDYDENRLSIARDVALALEYLHNRADAIIHRDVGAKNVLLLVRGAKWCAKLSDFGTATLQSFTPKEENPGCPRYTAPEAGIPSRQTPKVHHVIFVTVVVAVTVTNTFTATLTADVAVFITVIVAVTVTVTDSHCYYCCPLALSLSLSLSL